MLRNKYVRITEFMYDYVFELPVAVFQVVNIRIPYSHLIVLVT